MQLLIAKAIPTSMQDAMEYCRLVSTRRAYVGKRHLTGNTTCAVKSWFIGSTASVGYRSSIVSPKADNTAGATIRQVVGNLMVLESTHAKEIFIRYLVDLFKTSPIAGNLY